VKLEKRVMTVVTQEVAFVNVVLPVNYGDEDMPADAPGRTGNVWEAMIDINSGTIEGWPQGETLRFSMKVCDQGSYILLDRDGNEIASIVENYVPNDLIPGRYGDYVDLNISGTGKILNWKPNANLADFVEEDE
jgi:hypothetical protein